MTARRDLTQEQIDSAVRAMGERLRHEADAMLTSALTGTSTTTPETTLDLAKEISKWEQMIRNFRRSNITFVVDLAHVGPAVHHETPNDGTRVEMSFAQAQELHKSWPLRLHEILDRHSAEFVPASSFDTFVPAILPMPPFEPPQGENEMTDTRRHRGLK